MLFINFPLFSLSFNNRLSESEVREPGGGRKGRQVSIFAVGYDAQRLLLQIYVGLLFHPNLSLKKLLSGF
jgi:hypothetical protein